MDTRFKSGQIPWMKGKKYSPESILQMSLVKKGKHLSPSTEFKKGMKPWCAGTKGVVRAWNKGLKGVLPPPWNKSYASKNCKKCGNEFHVKPFYIKLESKKFCSLECFHRSKKTWMLKENNPRWNNGATKLVAQIRGSFEYRQWRSDVFKRDRFTCQDCGDSRSGIFQAHHKKSFFSILKKYSITTIEKALTISELWDINNGITLCKKCHIERHKRKLVS